MIISKACRMTKFWAQNQCAQTGNPYALNAKITLEFCEIFWKYGGYFPEGAAANPAAALLQTWPELWSLKHLTAFPQRFNILNSFFHVNDQECRYTLPFYVPHYQPRVMPSVKFKTKLSTFDEWWTKHQHFEVWMQQMDFNSKWALKLKQGQIQIHVFLENMTTGAKRKSQKYLVSKFLGDI